MTSSSSSPIAQDKLVNALKTLAELSKKSPEKSRKKLLQEVELKYDLTPLECEFLDKNFSDKLDSTR